VLRRVVRPSALACFESPPRPSLPVRLVGVVGTALASSGGPATSRLAPWPLPEPLFTVRAASACSPSLATRPVHCPPARARRRARVGALCPTRTTSRAPIPRDRSRPTAVSRIRPNRVWRRAVAPLSGVCRRRQLHTAHLVRMLKADFRLQLPSYITTVSTTCSTTLGDVAVHCCQGRRHIVGAGVREEREVVDIEIR